MTSPIQSEDELDDFMSYVILYAPDRFPVRAYHAKEGPMTLERAFSELRAAANEYLDQRIQSLLEDAFRAYRQGDSGLGARLLQQAQATAFPG